MLDHFGRISRNGILLCVVFLFILSSHVYSQSEDLPARLNQPDAGRITLTSDQLGLGDPIQLQGSFAETTLSIPIPEGLLPRQLELNLEVGGVAQTGVLTISSSDRILETIQTQQITEPQQLFIDLQEIEPSQGVIPLTFSIQTQDRVNAEAICSEPASLVALLSDLEFTLVGDLLPPETLDQFWPSYVSSLVIVMPEDASGAHLQAAARLTAFATQQARGNDIRVQTVPVLEQLTEASPSDQIFQRVVVLTQSDQVEPAQLAVQSAGAIRYLEITASDTEMIRAAQAVTSVADLLPPEESTTLNELGTIPDSEPARSIGDLSAIPERMMGTGTMNTSFLVSQSALGGSVESFDLTVIGKHSPIEDQNRATVQIYANNQLLNSQQLGESGEFSIPVTVDQEVLQRDNQITVEVLYTAPDGKCIYDEQPLVVDIDPSSPIDPQMGPSLNPGFQTMPQALFPQFSLVVANRSNQQQTAALQLIAMLQRLSPLPLQPQVLSLDAAVEADQPIVAVISDSSQAEQLNPPFDLTRYTITNQDGQTLASFQVDTPYTAMQAYEDPNHQMRPSILLSSTATATNQAAMLELLTELPNDGWYSLTGDLYLQTVDGRVINEQIQDAERARLRRAQPLIADAVDTSPDVVLQRVFWIGGGAALVAIVIGVFLLIQKKTSPKK